MSEADLDQLVARIDAGVSLSQTVALVRQIEKYNAGLVISSIDQRHIVTAFRSILSALAERDRRIAELKALLTESQSSIGGDWRARRDAALKALQTCP